LRTYGKIYQLGLYNSYMQGQQGEANLCAYEQANAESYAEAGAEVILGPEIVRHVFDDRPVRFPLLFVRHRLLG
jgi:hypothetical protein